MLSQTQVRRNSLIPAGSLSMLSFTVTCRKPSNPIWRQPTTGTSPLGASADAGTEAGSKRVVLLDWKNERESHAGIALMIRTI
jgi:hypothetical protein